VDRVKEKDLIYPEEKIETKECRGVKATALDGLGGDGSRLK